MKNIYCLQCPRTCLLTIVKSGHARVVEGNQCPKGERYADEALDDPEGILATTVRTRFPDIPAISVRTASAIPRTVFPRAMGELSEVVADVEYACGDVLVEDIADTGVSVIVTSYALMQLGAELENTIEKLDSVSSSSSQEFFDGDPDVRYSVNGGGGVLNELGGDGAVGGFVGAAGEAVGVADGASGDGSGDGDSDSDGGVENSGDASGKEFIPQPSRPHIKR